MSPHALSDGRLDREGTCESSGCDRPIHARRLCHRHYRQELRAGSRFQRPTADERFAQLAQPMPSGCVAWTGRVGPNGYGYFTVDGLNTAAHRFAWERVNGPIPADRVVDHSCHNRACVNVAHLRLATVAQNDANRAGTTSATGARNVYKRDGRYMVAVQKNGRLHNFGRYDDLAEAREVARAARRELFGAFAGRG